MVFLIEVEVDEDILLNHYLEENDINPENFDGTIEDIIELELGWVEESGIIFKSVKIKEND
jgi:hypothetical protein